MRTSIAVLFLAIPSGAMLVPAPSALAGPLANDPNAFLRQSRIFTVGAGPITVDSAAYAPGTV